MNPESSDPKDPETNTWWIWLPLVFIGFVIFMALVFGRQQWYEDQVAIDAIARLA